MVKMKSAKFLVSALAIIAGIAITTAFVMNRDDDSEVATHEQPAHVEVIEGSELSRVTLTERAAERLDIQTAAVTEESVDGSRKVAVPYASVIYDTDGNAWVYANPEGLVFERVAITVDSIEGEFAYVSEGPEVGTMVVTVGGAMLYGTEVGVGH
jgi:hypothetical protein